MRWMLQEDGKPCLRRSWWDNKDQIRLVPFDFHCETENKWEGRERIPLKNFPIDDENVQRWTVWSRQKRFE
jgi:hypothetical protein